MTICSIRQQNSWSETAMIDLNSGAVVFDDLRIDALTSLLAIEEIHGVKFIPFIPGRVEVR